MSPSQQQGTSMDQEGDTAQRKTRAPYIARACIECKRRKQRCSGQDPCKNCENRSVQCKYGNGESPPSNNENTDCLRTVSNQVHSLSELVESMQAEIRSLKYCAGVEETNACDKRVESSGRPLKKRKLPPTTLAVSTPSAQGPRYQGPTSAEYSLKLTSLNLARLQNPEEAEMMGSMDACYEGKDRILKENVQSPQTMPLSSSEQISVQVFTQISHTRARELVNLYAEVVGSLHPVVDISILQLIIDGLYSRLKATKQQPERLTGRYDVIVIRLILAIALLSEQNQNTALIESCYEGVEQELNSILCSETVSLRGVTIILIHAIYHLFTNKVRMAWRLCGLSASLAMELGLHQPGTLQKAFPDERERAKAVRVMWSIFILDHGWSAALGLPRNFDDAALEGSHLAPDDCTYLRAMMPYCTISTKIVTATSRIPVSSELYEEERYQFLNYQIDRWQQSVLDGHVMNPAAGHNFHLDVFDPVSTLLYLRANQLRILLLRPLFFSRSPVKPDQAKLSTSIHVAIRTISVIYHLNTTTDNYRRQHPFFSHFLISATSLILLIATYHENNVYESPAQDPRICAPQELLTPLKQAVELISAYSNVSNYSKQLQERLSNIMGPLSRLGILQVSLPPFCRQGNSPTHELTEPQSTNGMPYVAQADDFMPTIYTSPPLTSIGTVSQQQDSIPEIIPIYEDDHQQMDALLNLTVWNEIDTLIASRLNSAEVQTGPGDPSVQYASICE